MRRFCPSLLMLMLLLVWAIPVGSVYGQTPTSNDDEVKRSLDEVLPETAECTADLAHAELVGKLISLGDSVQNNDIDGAIRTLTNTDPPYVSCIQAAVDAIEPGQLPALQDCLTEPGQVGTLCRQLLMQRVQELLSPLGSQPIANPPGAPVPAPGPAPAPSAPLPADGTLLKGSDGAIYIMNGGAKHLFPDWDTFLANGGAADLSNVRNVGDAQLGTIPNGGPIAAVQAPPPTAAAPTPQPAPRSGDILYQADASNGFRGFRFNNDWKIVNGQLLNDASATWTPTFAIPSYVPPTPNYVVETEIQIIPGQSAYGFGIGLRMNENDGYRGGFWAGFNNGALQLLRTTRSGLDWEDHLGDAPFSPKNDWHKYRLEANGNHLILKVDENLVFDKFDNQYLSQQGTGLWSRYSQIAVRSFKIIMV